MPFRLHYVRSSEIVLVDDPTMEEGGYVDDTSLAQAAELVARFGPGRVLIEGGSSSSRKELHHLVGFCVCNPQPPDAGAEVCARDLTRFSADKGDGSDALAIVEHLQRAGYRVRFANRTRDTLHDRENPGERGEYD